MKFKRPKLNIKITTGERIWNYFGSIVFISAVIYLIYIWGDLPKEVPTHYNAAGEVDRWGSKWELLVLPVVGLFIIIFMSVAEKYPELHNYPKRFNRSNAKRFYLRSRVMMNQLKNISLLIVSLILIESIRVAIKKSEGVGGAFIPLLLTAAFIPLLIYLFKIKKIN